MEFDEPFTPTSPVPHGGPWLRQTTPDDEGVICEAVVLSLELPESSDDKDLDEISRGWLRLRRGVKLLPQQHIEAKLPSSKWIPEGKPPTVEELAISGQFSAFVINQHNSLEEAYENLNYGNNGVTVFELRNRLAILGGKEWPAELPSAEKLFRALCSLHRASDSIPRDKFLQLNNWIDAEKRLNRFEPCVGLSDDDLSNVSGARLRSILSGVGRPQESGGMVLEALHCVDLLLDLEPKACLNMFLLDSDGNAFGSLVDLVIRQGLTCIKDESLMYLWKISQKILRLAFFHRRPRPALTTNTPRLRGIVQDVMRSRANSMSRKNSLSAGQGEIPDIMTKSNSSGAIPTNRSRASTPNETPDIMTKSFSSSAIPTSGQTPRKDVPANGSEQRLASTSITLRAVATNDVSRASTPQKDAPGNAPDRGPKLSSIPIVEKADGTKKGSVSLPSLSKSQSSPMIAAASDLEKRDVLPDAKVVRRKTFSKGKRTATLPDAFPNPSSIKNSPSKLPDVAEEAEVPRPGKPILRRRATIGNPGDTVEPSDIADKEWELNCCAIFWKLMPPQSITYAIGVGLHSVSTDARLTKLLRTAWSLFDVGLAAECSIGEFGILRLRTQMDILIDQFCRCMSISKTDEDSVQELLTKGRLTLLHLQSMATDPRFARMLVLYGVAFIAEGMCTWSQSIPDGESMNAAAHELVDALKVHSIRLFQRR